MNDGGEDLLTAIPDALLLRRFYQGDEASFETLFQRHYDMVYGVLFRLTGTREQAEDLAQEVFLKLTRGPLAYGDNIAGWLYRVAVNSGYNALRESARRGRRERIAAGDEPSSVPGPEEEAQRRAIQARVRWALARIPARSAKLLVLREAGFSYRELAEIVGVAPGSVGTLLARAQAALARAYHERDGLLAGHDSPGSEGKGQPR
jgi:RNA polymerase sigma-70 factor (ECF subfamily)